MTEARRLAGGVCRAFPDSDGAGFVFTLPARHRFACSELITLARYMFTQLIASLVLSFISLLIECFTPSIRGPQTVYNYHSGRTVHYRRGQVTGTLFLSPATSTKFDSVFYDLKVRE